MKLMIKGFTNESELINEFWPNMTQPITKPVEISVSDNVISLKCETKGSVHRISNWCSNWFTKLEIIQQAF